MGGLVRFFLTGVVETTTQVVQTSLDVSSLFRKDQEKITTLKRAAFPARQVHEQLKRKAIANATSMASALEVSVPTAPAALNNLKAVGVVKEIKGSGKERLYIYTELIDLLDKVAEPISLKKL